MKKFWSVLSCIAALLGLVPGRGDECDIYIANAGAGNCIYVLFSAQDAAGDPASRGLWVDCGFGKRGLVPDGCANNGSWDKVVEDYFFFDGAISPSSKASRKDTMLWITHLHEDHVERVNLVGESKRPVKGKSARSVGVGAVIVGVGGGNNDLPMQSGNGNLIGFSTPIQEIFNTAPLKVKVWGTGHSATASRQAIRGKVEGFLGEFPYKVDRRENIRLKPLIPSSQYKATEKGTHQVNLVANDTSLVLGLEYYGVKILFPGDAPGEMHDCLRKADRKFVKDVDILVAPHHGSEAERNGSWYSSNRRFCTIISGDPSYSNWGLPVLASYGVRDNSIYLKDKRSIYYSNALKEVCTLKTRVPVFCTWVGVEDKNGEVVGAEKFVGYHIKINSKGGREDAGKIKVFEILYDGAKAGRARYSEKEIKIVREKKTDQRKCLLL
ncbi:MAG: hypothetical protein LW808_001955 [Verrucomicrobiota bacterium]|nr:MAG: hypothetical protein LW808_001955 [Verrucomicrobiota bacterium]